MNEINTLVLSDDKSGLEKAAEIIKSGGIVAFPTETVYGLGANALSADACLKIFKAKGRAADNPLIVHICDIDDLYGIVSEVPDKARVLAEHFWSGPLTMIFRKKSVIPDEVTCNMDTVAVRFPSHPTAQALIRLSGVPIAAPSANLSGSPSPVTAQHCIRDLTGRADAVINGSDCECGVESTILLMTAEPPVLLRPGSVTVEQIESVIGKIKIDKAVLEPLEPDRKVLSPGLKYKHYSPKARVIIVDAPRDKYIDYVNSHAADDVAAMCFDGDESELSVKCVPYGDEANAETQAHGLFSALRSADELGVSTVYARLPDKNGVGLAVLNRLLRAAGFEKIKL